MPPTVDAAQTPSAGRGGRGGEFAGRSQLLSPLPGVAPTLDAMYERVVLGDREGNTELVIIGSRFSNVFGQTIPMGVFVARRVVQQV